MEAERLPERAAAAGERLSKALEALPEVASVRGLGLLLAACLTEPVAKDVAARCLQEGLVLNAVTDDALRLAPPLTVSDAETDEALGVLGRVLSAPRPVAPGAQA